MRLILIAKGVSYLIVLAKLSVSEAVAIVEKVFCCSSRSVGIGNSYAQKKKHRKHLLLKRISQTKQVFVCGSIYILLCWLM
jgi:hypothetical protein